MLNPYMPNGLYLISLDKSISYIKDVLLFLLLSCFVEMPELNANSVEPDHTPRTLWVYTVCQCPFYGKLGLNGHASDNHFLNIWTHLFKASLA